MFHCSFSECINASDKNIHSFSLFCCEQLFPFFPFFQKKGWGVCRHSPKLPTSGALLPPNRKRLQQDSEVLSSTRCPRNPRSLAQRGPLRTTLLFCVATGDPVFTARLISKAAVRQKDNQHTEVLVIQASKRGDTCHVPVAGGSEGCEAARTAAPESCLLWGRTPRRRRMLSSLARDHTKTTTALPSRG